MPVKTKSYLVIAIISVFVLSCTGPSKQESYKEPESGKNLLPVPQKMLFTGGRFEVDGSWTIKNESSGNESEAAVKSLIDAWKEKAGITPGSEKSEKKHGVIRLSVKRGSVMIPESQNDSIANQAYVLKLQPLEISVEANSPAGLYYGIQTLIQLSSPENGKVVLPEGEITDWPDLAMRMIYWDCAHHLDRVETFRRAIDRASHYKINALTLKLEGHFQFRSALPVVEPYAFTPEEYQELTDYANDHFVQLVPYLDAPAHVSFILKHPEYKALRAIPNSNYELGITKDGTYSLLSGMFGDLMDANKGGKYILLSTDEAYYSGKAESEKEAARKVGGNGRLLASFITRVADELHGRGRTVISWCEYPLAMQDIEALPPHLVNGVYNDQWSPAFRKRGIRQFIYTSAQGEEPLFPDYYRQHEQKGRVAEIVESVKTATDSGKSEIPGIIVAAWGDSGLQPETFWLGYVAGTSAAWNLQNLNAADLTSRFFKSFYGNTCTGIDSIYRLLSSQAQYWKKSWLTTKSSLRTPIVGNSRGIYDKPRPATDQTLPLLPVPSSGDLSLNDNQLGKYLDTLDADTFIKENDELIRLLDLNISKAPSKLHNLEIFRSIAMLCKQNLDMLSDLRIVDSLIHQCSAVAAGNPEKAISLLDSAIEKARLIIEERTSTFSSVEKLWYLDWYPVVEEANGRKFLFSVDDVKDHLPGRTTDLSYLIYRQIHYPLEKWINEMTEVRNKYAAKQ
jgi:hypothetical protein